MHRILLVLVLMIILGGCSQSYRGTETTELAAVGLGASQELGTFSTKFDHTSDEGRATNIKLASDAINQSTIQPGEEFSFNNSLGPTTEKNGYKEAVIYVNGEKDKGFGGGVCQVSSTLYNAAANAGMTILERHDHSLPVTYVEKGKEAATSYGVKDFRFKNDLGHPVTISSNVVDGNITVSINGA